MLAPNNIFSPSSGKPITTPSQDITPGLLLHNSNPRLPKKDGRHLPLLETRTKSNSRWPKARSKRMIGFCFKNPDRGQQTIFGNSDINVIETTAGCRRSFNQIWPKELGLPTQGSGQETTPRHHWRLLSNRRPRSYGCHAGQTERGSGLDEATRAGISIGIEDMIIPNGKNLRWTMRTSRSNRWTAISSWHHYRRRALQQNQSISGRMPAIKSPT